MIRFVDELPEQVYRMLVCDKKSMGFLPLPESEHTGTLPVFAELDDELEQPDDDGSSDRAAVRQTDSHLQTRLTSAKLQTRLLRMYGDAQTAIEEQGINILYVAVGFLKWYDADSSDRPMYAPLILVPARLDRRSATSKFRVSWSEEDLETNESLSVKLQKEFGIGLPRLPDDSDALTPSSYFEKVQAAVVDQSRWEVVDGMALGFFASGKLRLWKDLDPAVWAHGSGPVNCDIVNAIPLGRQMQEPSTLSDEDFVDHLEGVSDLLLVKDADSSQTLTIHEVVKGRNTIVQGPPGTGKSQTITNIIANTVSAGKTVLFVSEKMAALEVVKRWLDQVGLGGSCLELHSFKARKTHVLDSIRQTAEAMRPAEPDHESESKQLEEQRTRLNDFAFAMNTPLVDGGTSPHKAIGIAERFSGVEPRYESVPIRAAATWTEVQLRQARSSLELAAKHLAVVDNPREHPWRGVAATALLPDDCQRLGVLVAHLQDGFKQLLSAMEAVGGPLGLSVQYTLSFCAPIMATCDLLLQRPDCDLSGISSSVWQESLEDIRALLSNGRRFAILRSGLMTQVSEDALGQDYADVREAIQARGRSPFRLLSSDYRRARARLRQSCIRGRRPNRYDQAMALLDDLCEYRDRHIGVTCQWELGNAAFGTQWAGLQSNWTALVHVAEWVPQIVEFLKTNSILANCGGISPDELKRVRDTVTHVVPSIRADLSEWAELLKYEYAEAFQEGACDSVPLQSWISRLESARTRVKAVFEWIEYRKIRDICHRSGMADLVHLFDRGGIAPDRLVRLFDFSSALEILRAAMAGRPALKEFSSANHEHLIERFRDLDRKLIETTRQLLAARLWRRMPQLTIGNSNASPETYLLNTMRRRRGIPPIRQLMERAGNVIVGIKPCFMMSPMSVAQFLPPNTVEFDVLVIDEASQMKPEDALGALARCKQCVIVGDSKQLPPTAFFDRLTGTESEEEDIGDVESILEAAAKPIGGMQEGRMLRWHYRSRHESLIAFSNKEFYSSKLHVFPSPLRECGEMGLVGHYVPNGVYGRGGSKKNLVEAEVVARAVMSHATMRDDQSLGVVALSRPQQEAIVDKLEELRRENPNTKRFFDTGKTEPFFVKNLENVQGDERDVMFISVGYGRDANGLLHMNFGPINQEGGWRRLNVLITRARLRCDVFHSIRPDEIRVADLSDAESSSLRGRLALRNYLEYVRTGQLEQPGVHGLEAESPFEESVAGVLKQHGVDTVPQVGMAGFRIDLGVIDPSNPGKYILGIECDGATYHRARSARDRDRLRQEVLERLGWRIHRVWSLDWWKDPEKELRKLLLAIEEAKAGAPRADLLSRGQPESTHATIIERTNLQKEAKHPNELVSSPYSRFTLPELMSGHPSDIRPGRLTDLVCEIVAVESPIHMDELGRRVAETFGLQRTGKRVQDAVAGASRRAESRGIVKRKGNFLWLASMYQPGVRNRLEISMDIERIAPEEIHAAAEMIRGIAPGMAEDALVAEVAKSLGYQRLHTKTEDYLRNALRNRR